MEVDVVKKNSDKIKKKKKKKYIYIYIGSLQVDFRVEQCSIR